MQFNIIGLLIPFLMSKYVVISAAELDLESSTSSSSSTSNGDISDQDMDVSEIPLALPEGEEPSQALVPLASIRPNNPPEEGTKNENSIDLSCF